MTVCSHDHSVMAMMMKRWQPSEDCYAVSERKNGRNGEPWLW